MRKQVISIDLGGTNVKAGLVDSEGRIIRRLTQPTSQAGRQAILTQMTEMVEELRVGETVQAVGIGSPGFVNSDKGRILVATNLNGWSGTDVYAALTPVLKLPVVLRNDADMAAAGEAWVGAGKNLDSFFMITLGTGVGGAFFERSLGVWDGATYRGGEVGHAILYPRGRLCPCGQTGCVEQYLSGRSLERGYLDLTGESLSCREIFFAAKTDKDAQAVTTSFVSDLGVLLTSLANTFDPQVFLIGGGLVHLRQAWWSGVEEAFAKECLHGGEVPLLPATTGNDAGLLGAAYLAFLAAAE